MAHWFNYPTNVDPIAIHLGFINVHWYGIAYLAGFVAVYLWMSRPEGRRRLGLTSEQIQGFLFYALIGVLVGGRTFFVINDIISKHDLSYYTSNPLNIIAVWQGGMAFHGGMVGVLIAIWLFIRKHPQLKYTVLGDEVVDTGFGGNGAGGHRVVAGDHDGANAHRAYAGDALANAGLQHIG